MCCGRAAGFRLAEFVAQALISDAAVYDEAAADLEGFWLDGPRDAGLGDAAEQLPGMGSAALHVVRRRHG